MYAFGYILRAERRTARQCCAVINMFRLAKRCYPYYVSDIAAKYNINSDTMHAIPPVLEGPYLFLVNNDV